MEKLKANKKKKPLLIDADEDTISEDFSHRKRNGMEGDVGGDCCGVGSESDSFEDDERN